MPSLTRLANVSLVGGVLLVLASVGCGGGPVKPAHLPDLVSCSVKVTHNGTPVEGAKVLFAPETGNFAAAGTTDKSGAAVLYTDGAYAGVVAGSYKVSVTKLEVLDVDFGPTPSDPVEYAAWEKKLRDQPKPKHLIPEKYSSFGSSGLSATVSAGSSSDPISLELAD